MSSAEDRYRAAISTMEAAAREQDEQRGLRERRLAEAQQQAREGMRQELAAAQKYAEHMDELNKRKQSAGGWATEKTLADKSRESLMEFGVHDEEADTGYTNYPTPSYGTPAVSPHPEPAPEPPAAAPEPPRRGRHARQPDDEDDFSSTSWLV
ncbi:hypothetical protein [Amycolatopsis vancoresmycina]|uniref:Uncharacterized protein n=1 Tax=Amycolatopsis vancoresmycina DSM 44592 TaxID=1292037 RepID=R1HSQ6_9PSEU|nr:hypothetical protein [Amycolatopsis vancoresmycina]EOD63361.1 hypothetical protein H480_37360 [Amycolatopsis vancoresmycina DSM 44592]